MQHSEAMTHWSRLLKGPSYLVSTETLSFPTWAVRRPRHVPTVSLRALGQVCSRPGTQVRCVWVLLVVQAGV